MIKYNYKVGGGMGIFLKKWCLFWLGITGGSKFDVGGANADTGDAAGRNGLTKAAGSRHGQGSCSTGGTGHGIVISGTGGNATGPDGNATGPDGYATGPDGYTTGPDGNATGPDGTANGGWTTGTFGTAMWGDGIVGILGIAGIVGISWILWYIGSFWQGHFGWIALMFGIPSRAIKVFGIPIWFLETTSAIGFLFDAISLSLPGPSIFWRPVIYGVFGDRLWYLA